MYGLACVQLCNVAANYDDSSCVFAEEGMTCDGECIDENSVFCGDIFANLTADPSVVLAVSFSAGVVDESASGHSLSVSNYELGPDRYGNPNGALHPLDSMPSLVTGTCNDLFAFGNAPNNYLRVDSSLLFIGQDNDAYAFSMWVENRDLVNCESNYVSTSSNLVYGVAPFINSQGIEGCYYNSALSFYADVYDGDPCSWVWGGFSAMLPGEYLTQSVDTCLEDFSGYSNALFGYTKEWENIILNKDHDTLQLYVGGSLVQSVQLSQDGQPSYAPNGDYTHFGFGSIPVQTHDFVIDYFRGIQTNGHYQAIDDIIVLNRSLSTAEIAALASHDVEYNVVAGCTDCEACNFDISAQEDDGSCNYACYGCTNPNACNYNFSSELDDGSCFYIGDFCDDEDESTCGDSIDESCNCSGNSPVNGLGEGPCNGINSLNFDGVEYELIAICNQCWFRSNLKSTHYSNGDEISNADYIISEGGIDYGYLYNYNAVSDSRGLCPTGYEVPSLSAWQSLNQAVKTEVDSTETIGQALKAGLNDMPSWNGTNSMGFSAVPNGQHNSAGYSNFGTFSQFWTSTELNDQWSHVHGIYLQTNSMGIGGITGGVHDNPLKKQGVRCIKSPWLGCQDNTACNYDASANQGGVSCVYATGCDFCSGETDGTGQVLDGDYDNDGVCNSDEIAGCISDLACNYNSSATDDDGSCVFPEGCESCSGYTDGTGTVVDNDADDDGICDADEIVGLPRLQCMQLFS